MDRPPTCTACVYLTSNLFRDATTDVDTIYYGCKSLPGIVTGFNSLPDKAEPPASCERYTSQREKP